MKKLYNPLALCLIMLGCAWSASAQVTTTFSCPTTTATWTVPSGVTSVVVDLEGASGGQNSYEWFMGLPYCIDSAGHGARVQATLTVVPGQVLNIYVGGAGPNGVTGGTVAGGFNGGGGANYAPTAGITPNICGGAGGGASDIRIGGVTLADRVVVAGGGAGAGGNYCTFTWPSTVVNYDKGGDGGGTTGESGWDGLTVGGIYAGLGGTGGGGGAGGLLGGGSGTVGDGGAAGVGTAGGGGGGGYYGGGGGSWGGGGGGSSYTDPVLCTAVTHTRGYNAGGCGSVSITILCTPPSGGTIVGPTSVCVGSTITLTDPSATPGGTWTSSNPGVATIGTSTGIVTGGTPGTTTITYSVTNSCSTATATTVVTVNPIPVGGTIIGPSVVCPGSTITLTDPTGTPGGTWTSLIPAVATVAPTTGVVTGGTTTGPVTIVYTISTACGTASATDVITVNSTPANIVVPPVCLGNPVTLTDTTPGGSWSSSNPLTGTIDPLTGVFNPLALGTTIVTYNAGGCNISTTVTVNPMPAAIVGPSVVCRFLTMTLTDATTGGSWSSSVTLAATVNTSGVVTGVGPGGSATNIFYTLPTGCAVSHFVSITTPPLPITGPNKVCQSNAIVLGELIGGGTWTTSNPAVASVTSGVVTGLMGGVDTISYTTNACPAATHIVTVNPLPAIITGPTAICSGVTTTLSDATPGGSWSSITPGITVSPLGVVTSSVVGLSGTILYTLPTGCFVAQMVNVNNPPAAISLPDSICQGATATLTDDTLGGIWSSTDLAIAPIVDSSGVVTGVLAGTVNISYTLPSGCFAMKPFIVRPPVTPSVTVTSSPGGDVCEGTLMTFTAVPVNGGTPTYFWQKFSVALGGIDSTGTYSFAPIHGDAIMVFMIPHGECALHDTVGDTFIINVYPHNMQPTITISTGNSDTIAYIGEVVTFFSNVTWGGTAPTYQWYKNNVAIAGATASSYTTPVYAPDTFFCKVTGNPPCEDATPSPGYSNPIVIHDYLGVSPVAVQHNALSLFPNPNNGSFTLTGTLATMSNNSVDLEISNMLGQVVYHGTTTPLNGKISQQIQLDGLAAGSYLLRVNTGSGNETFHFVIGK